MNNILKAKVQQIEVTGCEVEYEQVFVNSKYGKGRIMTYLLKGERGSKVCEMNGGAAQHFKKGEIVHLLFFHSTDYYIKPTIV